MYKYVKVDTDIWLKYDTVTTKAEVINKAELEKQQAFLTEQKEALPTLPDDKTLLKWSKENYLNMVGVEVSRTAIEAELEKITTDLSNIK
jgi:hypothetical protein